MGTSLYTTLVTLLVCFVYGAAGQSCPPATFGSLCQYTCHCQGGGSCDRNSGSCGAVGCAESWTGNDCQTVVPASGMSSTTLIIIIVFLILLVVHITGGIIYCVWRHMLKGMSDFQDYVDLEMTSPKKRRRSKENGNVTHLESRATGEGEGAGTLGKDTPMHWKEQEAMQEEQHYMAMSSGPPSEWTDSRYGSENGDADEREYHVLDESILAEMRSKAAQGGQVNPAFTPSELDQDEYEQPVPLKTSSFKSTGTDVNVSMSPGAKDAAETSRNDSGWGTDSLTSSNGESDYEPGQSDTLKQLYRAVDKKKKGGQRRKSSGALRPLPPPPDAPSEPPNRDSLPPPPPPPREGDVYVEPDQSDTQFDGDVDSDVQSTYDTLERQRKISSPYSLLGGKKE